MSGHQTLEDRFWSKVDKSGECWEWMASKRPEGYGWFRLGGRMHSAHRISLMLQGIDLSKSICVLHHCDNPSCVRPSHLFLGDRADNAKDRNNKNRQSKGIKHSMACSGEAHGSSILKNNDVKEIRRLCAQGVIHRDIAEKYGVHKSLISKVNLRSSWAYVR